MAAPLEEENLIKLDPEHLPYIGNKWGGKYLRAPEIYFKIFSNNKFGRITEFADIEGYIHGFNVGKKFQRHTSLKV